MHAPRHRPPQSRTDHRSGGRGISWIRSAAVFLKTRGGVAGRPLPPAALIRVMSRRAASRVRLVAPSARTALLAGVAVVVTTGAAVRPMPQGPLAVDSLEQVITNLRDVLVGLLVGLATLFATVGGVRYMLAGGDPSEVEAAKKTLKYAAVGYGVAVLAPVLVGVLQRVVGAP